MLILRMLSGLLAGFWRLLGGRQRKRFEASPTPSFQPEPTTYIPATAVCAPWPPLMTLEVAEKIVKLHRAAEWHAAYARGRIGYSSHGGRVFDGDGVIEHMRNFRKYSSQFHDKWDAIPSGSAKTTILCKMCGSTCTRKDMFDEMCGGEMWLVCAVCREIVSESWTDIDGRRTNVRDMDDKHLVESVEKVRKWLRNDKIVNDDRIRMCGHVLQECSRRGLEVSCG